MPTIYNVMVRVEIIDEQLNITCKVHGMKRSVCEIGALLFI
jgi:hypothetical protein